MAAPRAASTAAPPAAGAGRAATPPATSPPRSPSLSPGTGAPQGPAAPAPATATPAAARPAASTAAASTATPDRPAAGDLFARHAHAYAAARAGQQIAILAAGCTTAGDLGTGSLASGSVSLTMIDDDQPTTRAAAATHGGLTSCILADLRTVPLAPRAFDIVQCASLLERIKHTELVLDRLISAIKPGGLLMLQIRDRDSAAGFLDRVLPSVARRAIWRRRHPGKPGPYPAVYERLASARGIQAYALMRGLVIAERLALGGLGGGLPAGPSGFLAAQKFLARLSRGRLTAAHEELLYVLRKPENRFARVLLSRDGLARRRARTAPPPRPRDRPAAWLAGHCTCTLGHARQGAGGQSRR